MKHRKVLSNLLSKTPKIAIIIAVMFAIGLQRDSLFGITDVEQPVADRSYEVASGYAGPVPVELAVMLSIDSHGLVSGVTLGQNNETGDYLQVVQNSGLLSAWNGKTLAEAANFTPDAVSGATYSSQAIIDNVKREAAFLSANPEVVAIIESPYTALWFVEQVAVAAVLLLAFASYLWPAQMKRFRLALLILSIGVLGIWQGAFVSVQLLLGWVVNGTTLLHIGLLAILTLAIVIPLLFSKSFYCTFVCPFGALQELAAKIPVEKIPLNAKILHAFRWVKRILIIAFVLLILVNKNFEPAQWEPFSIFFINAAATSVIVIASVSVLCSVFIPRAWCRLLCPTGEIFLLLQRKQTFTKR